MSDDGFPRGFGRFQLLERLGIGGMAEVFLAQTPDGQLVVLKCVLPQLAVEQKILDLFVREFEVARALQHENIVRVLDAGVAEGTAFLTMELVAGMSVEELGLRAWGREVDLPLDVVFNIIADVAAGLDYAYYGADAVVHRDVSPDNLMVDLHGCTKILDFGIAKAANSRSLTRTGELRGKVPFMAPEQVIGNEPDHRSDLYALGVSLYWLVTRRRPFEEASAYRLVQAVIESTPPPPRELVAGLDPALSDYIMRLLSREPAERPQRGGEVASYLRSRAGGGRDLVMKFMNEMREPPRPASELTEKNEAHTIKLYVGSGIEAEVDLDTTQAFPRPVTVATTVPSPVESRVESTVPSGLTGIQSAPVIAERPDEDFTRTMPAIRRRRAGMVIIALGCFLVGVFGTWIALQSEPRDAAILRAEVPAPPAPEPVIEPDEVVDAGPELATLAIRAFPFARVYIDGRSYGRTPLAGVELSPGIHKVRLVYRGKTKRRRIDLEAGETELLKVRFRE